MILLTHFDETYRAQGQCMLKSFMRHASEYVKLFVLWLSDKPAFGESGVEVMSICQMYDERLMEARKNRSYRAWCWTLEPYIVHSCLKAQQDGEIVIYCDADMFWFADPIPTIRSVMENADMVLSPHWFPAGQEHKEKSVGHFNFGIAAFRACSNSRVLVASWLDQTLEKCDEFGAGDQIYLDEWPAMIGDRLAELPRTMNCGPWAIPEINGDPPYLHHKEHTPHGYCDFRYPLISFHFHEFRRGPGRNPVILNGQQWTKSGYDLHPSTVESVYIPYETALKQFLPQEQS